MVHGRGPRGGPWTRGQCFQLSCSCATNLLHELGLIVIFVSIMI